MLKIKTTFCQHCEVSRFDSNLDGRCRFCNTPLYEKEIELPELSSSDKNIALKYMADNRPVSFSTNGC
ncbi:hypothetical protein [Paenibacillus pectinilyticus]|uniref:hypothetical protein n=1 Tax=Paenibacillus pectinilyticus TaxID=512399 RepID=UPI00114C915E|nr:hypothetical protein [Paenibacillus pectinilyticus]